MAQGPMVIVPVQPKPAGQPPLAKEPSAASSRKASSQGPSAASSSRPLAEEPPDRESSQHALPDVAEALRMPSVDALKKRFNDIVGIGIIGGAALSSSEGSSDTEDELLDTAELREEPHIAQESRPRIKLIDIPELREERRRTSEESDEEETHRPRIKLIEAPPEKRWRITPRPQSFRPEAAAPHYIEVKTEPNDDDDPDCVTPPGLMTMFKFYRLLPYLDVAGAFIREINGHRLISIPLLNMRRAQQKQKRKGTLHHFYYGVNNWRWLLVILQCGYLIRSWHEDRNAGGKCYLRFVWGGTFTRAYPYTSRHLFGKMWVKIIFSAFTFDAVNYKPSCKNGEYVWRMEDPESVELTHMNIEICDPPRENKGGIQSRTKAPDFFVEVDDTTEQDGYLYGEWQDEKPLPELDTLIHHCTSIHLRKK